MFTSHLNVSNCMMGVYLAVLSVADQLHGRDYLWKERAWRSSPWCILSGFLFHLSCQTSVFVVTIATVERCWVLSRPRGDVKTFKVSALLCLISWITGFVLASVPAAWTSFNSTGACVPSLLPLVIQYHVHLYTVGVLVVLNGLLMSLTILGQGYIYATACRKEMSLIFDREASSDLRSALRMTPVSVTDACSWFVVVLMLLTSHGFLTSSDVRFTSTLLTMVTKPSANPYLCLLAVFLERRRETSRKRLLHWLRKNDDVNKGAAKKSQG